MDINWINEHLAGILYALAGLSLLIEVAIMGLSGPLLFIGIAAAITGGLVSAELISGIGTSALTVTGLTVALVVLGWKPLKALQNAGDGMDTSSDMIGRVVTVSEAIDGKNGSIRFSGIDWKARGPELSAGRLKAGTDVKIVAVDGNVMVVEPV